jgi:hypothetical protein
MLLPKALPDCVIQKMLSSGKGMTAHCEWWLLMADEILKERNGHQLTDHLCPGALWSTI